MAGSPEVAKPENIKKFAKIIEEATRELAMVIAEKHGSNAYHWDRDVVNMIVEKPKYVDILLTDFERICTHTHKESKKRQEAKTI